MSAFGITVAAVAACFFLRKAGGRFWSYHTLQHSPKNDWPKHHKKRESEFRITMHFYHQLFIEGCGFLLGAGAAGAVIAYYVYPLW